jgi:hypothetical protein
MDRNSEDTLKRDEPPIDGLTELLAWSAQPQCPAWQRDALRRLCAGPDIQISDAAELLEIMKGVRAAQPISDQHVRETISSFKQISLKSIRNVENINALAEGQILSFLEKGMTIVYGENGLGKSGYARILKSACRARLDKRFDILPNIYRQTEGLQQSAKITYVEGTTVRSSQWIKGHPGQPALSAISVFDASAGNISVTGKNDIAYTPFPLLVLGRLARVADDLRSKLTTEIEQFEGRMPPAITNRECSAHTSTGKLLGTLSGKTRTESVETLSTLNDTEKAELLKLGKDFADDPAAVGSRSLKLAQRIENLGRMMEAVAAGLNEDALARIQSLKHEIVVTTDAAHAEAERRFACVPLPVGGPAWQAHWEAARRYAENEAYPGESFPKTSSGSHCVLCQQMLDEAAGDRLAHFESFVVDELGTRIKTAKASLEKALEFEGIVYLQISKIAEIREYLINADEGELASAISTFLIHAAWRRRWTLRAGAGEIAADAPIMGAPPSTVIASSAEALRKRAAALRNTADAPERQVLKNRLDELADREWLHVVKDDVIKAISTKSEIEKLEGLKPQTARARITSKSTVLAKKLVTDRWRDRFALEVADLGISRLRVELRQEKSEAGVPRFKVFFVKNRAGSVGAVLSEGEQRCLAIAAFLAELETADSSSGIVLDDPITSLDHIYRQKIAARLAQESLQRQVIIFTHDIPFLSQLQQACKDAGISPLVRMVSRGGEVPGFCHDEAPTTHRSVAAAVDSLGKDLANKRHIFETGGPAWDEFVTKCGGILRKLWERAVEEAVSPVLTRWTHKVNTPGFIQLSVITEQDSAEMRKGYGICSIWEHYQPAAGNTPLPSADDISSEIKRLTLWFMSIKERQQRAAKG